MIDPDNYSDLWHHDIEHDCPRKWHTVDTAIPDPTPEMRGEWHVIAERIRAAQQGKREGSR